MLVLMANFAQFPIDQAPQLYDCTWTPWGLMWLSFDASYNPSKIVMVMGLFPLLLSPPQTILSQELVSFTNVRVVRFNRTAEVKPNANTVSFAAFIQKMQSIDFRIRCSQGTTF